MCNEVVEGGGGEDLSIEAQYQNAHIRSSLPESPSVDAGDNLIPRLSLLHMFVSLRLQFLDPRHLVTGRSIVTRDLGLDDDGRGAELSRLDF